jgi:hypothetical protein
MPKKKLPDDPGDYYAHNTVTLEELAELYEGTRGCSLDNLKKRSRKENWADRRHQIATQTALKADEILITKKAVGLASLQEKMFKLQDATIDVHLEFMQNLKGQIKDIQNPYLFDGERTNSLFQTAMNNAVKVLLAGMKQQEAEESEEEPPGFNISPDAIP